MFGLSGSVAFSSVVVMPVVPPSIIVSVVLAETLGSVAGNLCVERTHCCVGLEINANHVRAKRDGVVTGTTRPLHLGATTQLWQIEIHDERQRLICTSRITLAVLKKKPTE